MNSPPGFRRWTVPGQTLYFWTVVGQRLDLYRIWTGIGDWTGTGFLSNYCPTNHTTTPAPKIERKRCPYHPRLCRERLSGKASEHRLCASVVRHASIFLPLHRKRGNWPAGGQCRLQIDDRRTDGRTDGRTEPRRAGQPNAHHSLTERSPFCTFIHSSLVTLARPPGL